MAENGSTVAHAEPPGPFAERLRRPGAFTVCLAIRDHYDSASPPAADLRSCIAGCADQGLVQGIFISDRASGPGEPSTETLGGWILDHGAEPVLSLSLAARERSEALACVRSRREAGMRNILAVTGDYPQANGRERAVYDLDSVQLLMLLRDAGARGDGFPADLHKGCVVSPFKALESELMWQYARLRRKVEVGADFIVAQAGYDPRAWDELMRFRRIEHLTPPMIGTVLVPDAELALRLGAGRVPGVSVPSRLLERLTSPDGRAGLLLAAAAVAILRGLGYSGVLLGGRRLTPGEVGVILEEAERLAPRWEECLDEFQPPLPRFAYFRKDEKTGLNEDRLAAVSGRTWPHPLYIFSYTVDHVAFGPVEPIFRLLILVCRFCETRPLWKWMLWWLEYFSKVPLYRCRMCGDCTLYACGFFCSESGCPKRMVNGPCGGSRNGRCEETSVGTCMWVKAYDSLKTRTDRPSFTVPPIPPKDRRLEGTCSWINYCLGRDHRKLPIENHLPSQRNAADGPIESVAGCSKRPRCKARKP